MSIQVKFFASLRETLGIESINIDGSARLTVRDVWDTTTNAANYPVNTLCAINMDYAHQDDAVKDGDEVAFFPPVTGG
jgi:molybdopterin synthase sulfur carrier subunit